MTDTAVDNNEFGVDPAQYEALEKHFQEVLGD